MGKVIAIVILATVSAACGSAAAPVDAHEHAEIDALALASADPSEAAIVRWTQARGELSADCQDFARSAEIRWMSHAEVTAECGLGYSVSGCTTFESGAPVVMLADDATSITAAHEFVHVIEACVSHTVDNAHSDAKLWAGLMNGSSK